MNDCMLQLFYERPVPEILADPGLPDAHQQIVTNLENGSIRAASPDVSGTWTVHTWVKQAILAGFRHTQLVSMPGWGIPMFDKTAYPPQSFSEADGIRLVPGGSAIRRGACVRSGVVMMPPAYINVGAYVDSETMIDSHALVGSCAQIGKRVHVSAAAQIGGVLEPAGARPVIIEDDVFVGGLVGVFEGVHVGRQAVLAAGVLLTASTTIYDCVREAVYHREIPPGAVVVPGTRAMSNGFARQNGLSLSAPIIVKYRDEKTSVATALEGALR